MKQARRLSEFSSLSECTRLYPNPFLLVVNFDVLMSYLNNQIGPISGPTKRQASSGPTLYHTLMVFLKEALEKKLVLKKVS